MTLAYPFPDSGAGLTGWRPLRLRDPFQRGWDVYDLQCRLNVLSASLARDGVFGPNTAAAVKSYQAGAQLVVDGIAGSATQVAAGRAVCGRSPLSKRVLGQMQKESSFLCGIYTPPYENLSRDMGPVQMNTKYYPNPEQAFDVSICLPALVAKITGAHEKYVVWGLTDEVAWRAAQGSWNSPVYADRYAQGKDVPDAFIKYMDDVTIYA